ncbi:MAG: hypothetical protein AAF468_22245 [Pseudomonadota bacterium]
MSAAFDRGRAYERTRQLYRRVLGEITTAESTDDALAVLSILSARYIATNISTPEVRAMKMQEFYDCMANEVERYRESQSHVEPPHGGESQDLDHRREFSAAALSPIESPAAADVQPSELLSRTAAFFEDEGSGS